VTTNRFIFAVDHRPIMAEACAARGREADQISSFKRLAVEAVDAVRRQKKDAALSVAILLDDTYGGPALNRARELGIDAGQPVERGGVTPLELSRPDWKNAIVGSRPAFIKVRFEGSPEDPASERSAQEEKLVEISRVCATAHVPLLPEPLLTGKPDGATRAALLVRWIGELRGKGVQARWWKIEGLDAARDAMTVAEGLPAEEGLLILGKSAPLDTLRTWFGAARAHPAFQGFAVGRTIFWDPFLGHLDGVSEQTTVFELSERFGEVIDCWQSTR
jgi:5-dehydro-2-deoxygluconokinase